MELNADLNEEIKKIVSKILDIEVAKIGSDTHFVEELGADSMMALEIMAALEKKYGIDIPEEDLPKLASLSQIAELVKGKLKK